MIVLQPHKLLGLGWHFHRPTSACGTRSARILKLGHVLQFPAYPAAPLVVRLARRQLMGRNIPLAASGKAPQIGAVSIHSSLAPVSQPWVLQAMQRSYSGLVEATLPASHLAPPPQVQWLTATASVLQIPTYNYKFSKTSGAQFPNSPRIPLFLEQTYPQRVVATICRNDFDRPGLRMALASNPRSNSPDHGNIAASGPWRPPNLANRVSDTWHDLRAGPNEAPGRHEDRLVANYESSVTRTGNQAAEYQARSGAPSSATLHLDGAALGRWAVDHLGRVLAKPAKGMTGVDPRATIPRSRVSPF